MMKSYIQILIGCLFLLLGGGIPSAWAQTDDNPPEPQPYVPKYQLTVTVADAVQGSTSGTGKYEAGVTRTIRANANTDFTFSHWTKDNSTEVYSTSQTFSYTMTASPVKFVAHFNYTPANPSDPTATYKHSLSFKSDPEGCCSYSKTNGAKWTEGENIYVQCYPNQDYEFLGWFEGTTKVSSYSGFYYTMGTHDVTLTAKFNYNPADPADPEGGQQDDLATVKKGDLNNDKKVTIADLVMMIRYLTTGSYAGMNLQAADIEVDGLITEDDQDALLDKILGK